MYIKHVVKIIGVIALGLLLVCTALWGVLALYYFDHMNPVMRTVLASVFGLVSLIMLIGYAMPGTRRPALAAYLVLFAVLVWWWRGITPSNDREWQQDVAVLPYATIEGEIVTVHNIRNFDYHSEFEYTPRYYDKTYDMRKLDGVDLVAVYWMGPAVAHIFLSFSFAGGDHVAVSVETRKERGESYSTVQGFFRQYELFYVVADERDVIRLRTNYRKDPPEQVYVYRLGGPQVNAQRLFRQYMDKINSLKEQPQWYNTLTTNCTTVIWMNSRINPEHLPLSWKILATGYLPEYLYEKGRIDNSRPFAEIKRRSFVNARAQAADKAVDFSRRIRAISGKINPSAVTIKK